MLDVIDVSFKISVGRFRHGFTLNRPSTVHGKRQNVSKYKILGKISYIEGIIQNNKSSQSDEKPNNPYKTIASEIKNNQWFDSNDSRELITKITKVLIPQPPSMLVAMLFKMKLLSNSSNYLCASRMMYLMSRQNDLLHLQDCNLASLLHRII